MSPLVPAVLLLAACSGAPVPETAARPAEPPMVDYKLAQHYAFKGMELYSWSTREGGEEVFHYTLTFGTNRRKLLEEIQSEPRTLQQIEKEISKLPPGESLVWFTEVGDPKTDSTLTLPLPPKETIEELIAVAHARQIDLWVEGYSDR